jgi:hypothetical protein
MRALIISLLLTHGALALIGKKDWNKVDWDKAEKTLEDGDEADLLIDDDKLAMADYDKRRSKGIQKPEDDTPLK